MNHLIQGISSIEVQSILLRQKLEFWGFPWEGAVCRGQREGALHLLGVMLPVRHSFVSLFTEVFLHASFFNLTVVFASTVVIVGYCGVVIFSTCGASIGVLSVDRFRFLTLTRPLVFCVCRASNGSLYNFLKPRFGDDCSKPTLFSC